MNKKKKLQHERVDEIPFLLAMLERSKLAKILDKHLHRHHFHQGLSYGQLFCGWLAFLLADDSHAKVFVQDWANSLQHTLSSFFAQPVRPVDFSDDRLSIALRRLAAADWHVLESDLWLACCTVYQQLSFEAVRLDATASYAYHSTTSHGILQFGHSKDHRPDLPQFKLMAAVAQPKPHMIACDIAPGNCSDDELYLPLIKRLWKMFNKKGLLYVGDCKMAALNIRAEIKNHNDCYLMPIPHTGEHAKLIPQWIQAGVSDPTKLAAIYKEDKKGKKSLVAQGYELEREHQVSVAGKEVRWAERVQLYRSVEMQKKRKIMLEKRLEQATRQIKSLTPKPGRGRKQIRDEKQLQEKIDKIMKQEDVQGLLKVTWKQEVTEKNATPGKPSQTNPAEKVKTIRYEITEVKKNEEAIQGEIAKLGWRVQVTNLDKKDCNLESCWWIYNEGNCVEQGFHLLKDKPLGIQPLYVRNEDQIVGLTRFLTIGLRMMTLMEMQIREELEKKEEKWVGLFAGQPGRTIEMPTVRRVLQAIKRMEITLTTINDENGAESYLTETPELLHKILARVNLSEKIYTNLTLA